MVFSEHTLKVSFFRHTLYLFFIDKKQKFSSLLRVLTKWKMGIKTYTRLAEAVIPIKGNYDSLIMRLSSNGKILALCNKDKHDFRYYETENLTMIKQFNLKEILPVRPKR